MNKIPFQFSMIKWDNLNTWSIYSIWYWVKTFYYNYIFRFRAFYFKVYQERSWHTQMDYPQNLTESDRYWYDLIQKCRTSGKTDNQWLKENNIKPPTFYYHVKQLRKKTCELLEAVKRTSTAEIQEVFPVFFNVNLRKWVQLKWKLKYLNV